MTITFRCEHCHKDVKASDDATGKRGKCPFCGRSTYIPSPVGQDDVLPLVPIDESEERKLQDEIARLVAREKDLIAETGGEPPPPLDQREDVAAEDLHHIVVNYCLDMAGGNLQRAAMHVKKLRKFKETGIEAVEEFLAGTAAEAALDEIPPAVLKAFMEQLREQL